MRDLPPLDDDEAVSRWIEHELIALDESAHERYWRFRAGGTPAAALAAVDLREIRIDMKVPVGEARMINDVAAGRGLKTRTYVRRALGSILVVCDGLSPDDVPSLLGEDGVIRPR